MLGFLFYVFVLFGFCFVVAGSPVLCDVCVCVQCMCVMCVIYLCVCEYVCVCRPICRCVSVSGNEDDMEMGDVVPTYPNTTTHIL